MADSRSHFLQALWQPYPSVGKEVVDCLEARLYLSDLDQENTEALFSVSDTAKDPGPVWIGGRIATLSERELAVQSGGETLVLRWSHEPVMHFRWPDEESENVEACPLNWQWLSVGDLLCIRAEVAEPSASSRRPQMFGEGFFVATDVMLLAPGGAKEFRLAINVERSDAWAIYLSCLRNFFAENGFIEVQTPYLVPSPGTEPFLDPFETQLQMGSVKKTLFLPTSPEFHLKKMLVAGWTKVFELKTCFRNGELGEHHQPEFLMLEWYRAYSNLEAIMDDVAELLGFLEDSFLSLMNKGMTKELIHGRKARFEKMTIADLFLRDLEFRLTPATSLEELRGLCEKQKVSYAASDSWDEVFFRLFLEKIESSLGSNGPTIVCDYPPSQAALARINERGWADRFELYWRGLEIANAFHELNDPAENLKRFDSDALKKRETGRAAIPRDEELCSSLEYGMPPSGGIALGVDRLFMALLNLKNIRDTRAFPMR